MEKIAELRVELEKMKAEQKVIYENFLNAMTQEDYLNYNADLESIMWDIKDLEVKIAKLESE